MPRFDQIETVSQVIAAGGSNMAFSAVRPDKLKSNLVNLVTVVVDVSGSVVNFANDLLRMVVSVAEGCKKHPDLIDNVVLRYTNFNQDVYEVQGFAQFHTIDVNSYPALVPCGQTALYRATMDAIAATSEYAKQVVGSGRTANATIFVITDGVENASGSRFTAKGIAEAMDTLRSEETTESALTFLIGINADNSTVADHLQKFAVDARFDAYETAKDVDIEKLGSWIYRSIQMQSQALGSGQSSTVIPFNGKL